MDLESRALDLGTVYRFQLRLEVGTVVPAAAPAPIVELATGVRRAGDLLGRRCEAVAGALGRLGERRWRPVLQGSSSRDALAQRAFAGPEGAALPEAVNVAKEATPAEIARDLAEAGGELEAELAESLAVRVDDLDIPARVGLDEASLRYSPREYLETFSIEA